MEITTNTPAEKLTIGGNIYESAYKITDETTKKPNRR